MPSRDRAAGNRVGSGRDTIWPGGRGACPGPCGLKASARVHVVAFGHSRALLVWQRIIPPDGSSIRIDNVPPTDTQDYAGLSDRIDRHSWQLLNGVVLSTLLGVGTELGFGSSESGLVRAVRESAQQSGARARNGSWRGASIYSRRSGCGPAGRCGWSSTRTLWSRGHGAGRSADHDSIVYGVHMARLPAQGVISALRHVAKAADASVIHHWGDIDVAGVGIGQFIEASLPVDVVPI